MAQPQRVETVAQAANPNQASRSLPAPRTALLAGAEADARKGRPVQAPLRRPVASDAGTTSMPASSPRLIRTGPASRHAPRPPGRCAPSNDSRCSAPSSPAGGRACGSFSAYGDGCFSPTSTSRPRTAWWSVDFDQASMRNVAKGDVLERSVLLGWKVGGEALHHAVRHAERGHLPPRIDARAPLDQQPSDVPAAVAECVAKRAAARLPRRSGSTRAARRAAAAVRPARRSRRRLSAGPRADRSGRGSSHSWRRI